MGDDLEVWLSASEAAARLGLPVRAVIEMARAGAIPCVVGPIGAPRFRASDLDGLQTPAG